MLMYDYFCSLQSFLNEFYQMVGKSEICCIFAKIVQTNKNNNNSIE